MGSLTCATDASNQKGVANAIAAARCNTLMWLCTLRIGCIVCMEVICFAQETIYRIIVSFPTMFLQQSSLNTHICEIVRLDDCKQKYTTLFLLNITLVCSNHSCYINLSTTILLLTQIYHSHSIYFYSNNSHYTHYCITVVNIGYLSSIDTSVSSQATIQPNRQGWKKWGIWEAPSCEI